MTFLARVIELQTRFEVAHNVKPNIIVLGPTENREFERDVGEQVQRVGMATCPVVGRFFRGCRVLYADESCFFVGRAVEPLK